MEKDRYPTVGGPQPEAFGSDYATLGHICASAQSLEKLLQEGLQIIQGAVGCQAGGVRLSQPDGSLPFYVSKNLDSDFYRTEDLGSVNECICGAVARGERLGSIGFTPFGTFVTNGLQDYAAHLETCQWLTLRGRCVLTGYESVAIVPLRTEAAPLGVIYLADPRKGLFTRETLAFLEAASSLLAAAIPRLRELQGTPAAVSSDSTELLASLGHDLRTPLVPVKGLLNLILAEKVGQLSPKQKELLDICQLSIDREIELIDNLLESSRLRSGRLQLERAVFDLRGAIQDAVHYVQPLARERGAHVEVSLSAEELPVLGDRRRLLRVFANLLSNAVKYGRQGGRVDLKARAEGREVLVRVIDDGPGVPEEEREKIFEWLYRGPAAAGTPGSGLGLAIARDVAALHGGQIKVESGQPSVFAVRLPLAPEPPTEA
jgi:signal transduction histidine kinase